MGLITGEGKMYDSNTRKAGGDKLQYNIYSIRIIIQELQYNSYTLHERVYYHLQVDCDKLKTDTVNSNPNTTTKIELVES